MWRLGEDTFYHQTHQGLHTDRQQTKPCAVQCTRVGHAQLLMDPRLCYQYHYHNHQQQPNHRCLESNVLICTLTNSLPLFDRNYSKAKNKHLLANFILIPSRLFEITCITEYTRIVVIVIQETVLLR